MVLGEILAITIFGIGYILITLEHKIKNHKSAIALSLAGILWLITAITINNKEHLSHAIAEAGTEVFNIVAFLLAAMSLVEILIHYKFFDIIRSKLYSLGLRDRKQFIIIGFLTFFLSAILDNLTITIVMIQIARKFYKDENLIIVAAAIVIFANAGGAWSPIGDVTTIMLWLAHKFDTQTIIAEGILPSLTIAVIASALFVKKIKDTAYDAKDQLKIIMTSGEILIIFLTLISFTFPLIMNMMGLPPYMGLLLGLGIVWFTIEIIKSRSNSKTHLEANIETLLRKTDISSIQFFIGILLAVSALHTIGVLDMVSHLVLGPNPTFERIVGGNVVMGLLSAIVDNVPLTAIAIDTLHITDPGIWVLTAIAVGTGGSVLVIGSVAGVIAMGMVPQLTSGKYLKIASLPASIGYIAAIIVWVIQYNIMY